MTATISANDDCHAHDVLLCIQTGRTVSDTKRLKFSTDQFYMKSYEEMMQVFGELPEAVWRTAEIAERCEHKTRPGGRSFSSF